MQTGKKHPIRRLETIVDCFCAVLLTSPFMSAESLRWEWRDSKYAEQTLRHAKFSNAESAAITKAITDQVGHYTSDVELLGIGSQTTTVN